MSSFWWTLLAVLFAVFVPAKCQSTAHPVIPTHLIECYKDDGIYHRANRLPSSFEFFLDLVRKVEESQTARNMNARELALVLMHFLKQDGIQSIQSQNKYHPHSILPFAPSGNEFFLHRLILVGLIPKIDYSYMTVLNETLSKKEMCNLHFMLSYSIDPYKRENEKCSPLYEKAFKKAGLKAPTSLHQNIYVRRRNKRHIDHHTHLNKLTLDEQKLHSKLTQEKNSSRIKRNPGDKESDAEEIPIPQHPKAPTREEKDKFTIGNEELLSSPEQRFKKGMQSLVQMGDYGRSYGKPVYSMDESSYGGVSPDIPLSDCPVVNGIVSTTSGSLAIGAVVAGIAAGLNPEDIPPVKLNADPAELQSSSDRVKNIWGATLAGIIGDVIVSPASLEMDNFQILRGGWNDSFDTKWYLLENNQFKFLTEVALRGGLDGLYLGLHAKEMTGKYPNFKLSQLLQTYYDNAWGKVGAKNRVQLRNEYAPDELFRKQVYLMSVVIKKQKTNVLTLLNNDQLTKEALSKIIPYIQIMDDSEKSYIGSFLTNKIENAINMIAVVDSSWGHENLEKIFLVLRNARVAGTVGNNLTIVCAKDGRVLASSQNSADIFNQFTKDMLMENCSRGMDLPFVFDTLDEMYRKIYYLEQTSQKMNTDSQVAILFPFDQLLHDDNYVIQKSVNFRNNFPDVRLMIASNGRSDSYAHMVNNEKDLFSITLYPTDFNLKSIQDLSDGIKQSYHRITRPSCGSYFDDQSEGYEIRVTRDVALGNVAYYRLLPQYFYTQKGQAFVTIKSKLRVPLTVCHSREMERPFGPAPRGGSDSDYNFNNRGSEYGPDYSPEAYLRPYGRQTNGESDGPVECKTITSESYVIEMNNPCEGASNLQECRPLYVSIMPPLQETASVICHQCKLPTNAQYEITVKGLTCYNSGTGLYASPLLFLLIIYYVFKY